MSWLTTRKLRSLRRKSITAVRAYAPGKGKEIKGLVNKQRNQLEKISGMSVQEAKDCLLETLEIDVRQDAAKLIKR